MKIPRFLLFTAALLAVVAPLCAAQAPKLETLLAEYKKARVDVLGKLNEAYASQAETLVEQYKAVADLEGMNRAQSFANHLRDRDHGNAAVGATGSAAPGDRFAALQLEYARARAANLDNVYTFYATTAANLRSELLKSKDTAGAAVMTAFLEKISPGGASPTGTPTPSKTHKTASR